MERQTAASGIHRLAIPTPFPIGRVNAYLIDDEPLTLIDSGPNSATALDELERALALHSRRVEDLQLLVITHQHVDHVGLAGVLARRSGAEVAALAGLAADLGRARSAGETQERFGERVMHEHGVPAEVVMALRPSSAALRAWGSSVEVTRALKDGDELKLAGRTLTVYHRPGHSPSDTVFWDSRRRLLIAGDHLIEHVSSNPIAAPPLGVDGDYNGPRPQALVAYLDSLRQTREMDLERVLPGHGGPISDHVALIDARLRMHARRAEKIHRLLADGPLTAHEIAARLWGDMATMQTYLTLSEVLGHTDLLALQGRVSEGERGGVVRFAAS